MSGKGSTRRPGTGYSANWNAIFKKPELVKTAPGKTEQKPNTQQKDTK